MCAVPAYSHRPPFRKADLRFKVLKSASVVYLVICEPVYFEPHLLELTLMAESFSVGFLITIMDTSVNLNDDCIATPGKINVVNAPGVAPVKLPIVMASWYPV